ncbi:MAG: hypothetical protein KIT09_09345 [Bryobacteraceae bacterium]|nr:hypothetical protein [Bryobacteraceae bacterium]
MAIPTEILYLSQSDIAALGLEMADIVAAVETAFREKGRGQVEMPPKPGIHTRPDAFIHAMPAYVRSLGIAGMKWVSGYPENPLQGLPYISGLLILNDVETGFPLAVMDATWITANRTGAATAVAAKYLARPDPRSLAILGCGVQGRSNLRALTVALPRIERVYAYDVNDDAARNFCREASGGYGLSCEVRGSAREAVAEADIVVTAGPILRNPTPVIAPEWLREGAFVCALDFDSYAAPALFHAAAVFCADDVPQLFYYQKNGYFADIPANPTDLGDIVAGAAAGRKTSSELTVCVNLGLAVEDVVTAHALYRLASEKGAGRLLPL